MNETLEQLRSQEAFDSVAPIYEKNAPLETEAANRLIERITSVRYPPERIADLGCGTGRDCIALKRHFREAQVIGLDSSLNMVMMAANRGRHLQIPFLRPKGVWTGSVAQANFSRIPLPDQSIDLLFSNMALHWCDDPAALFAESRRVLRPDGLLLFSCLGPGSLAEIRTLLKSSGEELYLPEFRDLQSLGDELMAAGFAEPVVDAEVITLKYPRAESMIQELQRNGALGLVQGRLPEHHDSVSDLIHSGFDPLAEGTEQSLSYEVIYGTAFGPADGQPRKTPNGDVATFSVESLQKSLPS